MKKYLLIAVALLAAACAPKDGIRSYRACTGSETDLGTIKEIDGPVTVRLLVKNDFPTPFFPSGCTHPAAARR